MFDFRSIIRDEVLRHWRSPETTCTGSSPLLWPAGIAEGAEETGYLRESLKLLSHFLHETSGLPPVILIDEYDTPIHAAWQYGITRR